MALKDVLPGKLGFGAAPLGNMFRDIPENEALATVQRGVGRRHPLFRQCALLWRRPCGDPHGRCARRHGRATNMSSAPRSAA